MANHPDPAAVPLPSGSERDAPAASAVPFRTLLTLLGDCLSDPTRLDAVRAAAPEYVRDAAPEYARDAAPEHVPADNPQREFFLPVDATGAPALPDNATLNEVQTLLAHPEAQAWLALDAIGGVPALLVARWLCHLTGVRHRTVHLFLDRASHPGTTLVQVRSLSKVEAPGAFDMPVAGHVTGIESPEAALAHELVEELGLDLEDLEDLRPIGAYEALSPPIPGRVWHNREWRVVYRAHLRTHGLERVRFADGEVAGLALFDVDELQALVCAHPERVASGLTGSLPLYT